MLDEFGYYDGFCKVQEQYYTKTISNYKLLLNNKMTYQQISSEQYFGQSNQSLFDYRCRYVPPLRPYLTCSGKTASWIRYLGS